MFVRNGQKLGSVIVTEPSPAKAKPKAEATTEQKASAEPKKSAPAKKVAPKSDA